MALLRRTSKYQLLKCTQHKEYGLSGIVWSEQEIKKISLTIQKSQTVDMQG